MNNVFKLKSSDVKLKYFFYLHYFLYVLIRVLKVKYQLLIISIQ